MATTQPSTQRIFGFFDDWPPISKISCVSLGGKSLSETQDAKQWSIDVPGNDTYAVTVITVDGTFVAPSLYVPVGQNKYLTPDGCTKVGG